MMSPKNFLALSCLLLAAWPAVAQPFANTAPLTPGKPAGVLKAQAENNMLYIYGGLAVLAGLTFGLLAATSQSPPPIATTTVAAPSTEGGVSTP